MAHTHWKKLTNPNYLGAYSIEDGRDLILTIKSVGNEMVVGEGGKKEECTVCHFIENQKPMILNATNMKMIAKLYKSPYIEDWAGKKIQIGIEKVKAFGEVVDALRVRKLVPSTAVIKCENCGREIHAIGNMTAEQMATYTKQKYGCKLCADCATAKAKEVKNND